MGKTPECIICETELLVNPVKSPCGHEVCKLCLVNAFKMVDGDSLKCLKCHSPLFRSMTDEDYEEMPCTCNNFLEATIRGHSSCCQKLLEAGCDINEERRDIETALLIAAILGHAEFCEFLIEQKADINVATKRGNTSLILAAKNGNTQCCSVLLQHNADSSAVDGTGMTALDWAKKYKNKECCRILGDQ